jgi:hypothetical protein
MEGKNLEDPGVDGTYDNGLSRREMEHGLDRSGSE